MYVISRCTAAPRGSSSFQLLVSAVYRSMDTLMSLLLLHLCGGSRNYFSLRSLCCVAFKIDLYITYTHIYIYDYLYIHVTCVSMKLLQHAPSMMFAFLQASCSFLQTWPHRYIWLPYNIHLYISCKKEHNFITLTTIWVVWWSFLIGRNSLQNANKATIHDYSGCQSFWIDEFSQNLPNQKCFHYSWIAWSHPFFFSKGKWPTFQWHQTWLDGLGGLGIIAGFVGFGVVVAKLGKNDSTKTWVLATQMRS